MIRETTGIEFRPKTEEPSKEGWFYGISKHHVYGPDKIQPMQIMKRFNSELLMVVDKGWDYEKLDLYHWFGPVREVRESTP